jgi:hypothetical protein
VLGGEPPSAPGAPSSPSPPAAAPAPTGDRELDRVAAIDPRAVRSSLRGASGPAEPGPPVAGRAEPRASAPTPPRDEPSSGGKESKPAYKQWWFWVVIGVSAFILYDIASSDSDDDDQPARLDGPLMTTPESGPVLLRF